MERRQFKPTFSQEITTNAEGGSQQQLNYRFDLIDPHALYRLAAVLNTGAKKYGPDNWRQIPCRDHLNHVIEHVYAYLGGDTSEDHLANTFTRAMFALAVEGLETVQAPQGKEIKGGPDGKLP